MRRLLVFGLAPLPFENVTKNFGPGIRTWQFIKPLLKQDIQILLVANRIPFIYPDNTPPEVSHSEGNLRYIHMSESVFRDCHRIQDIHDQFNPDAILAATIHSTIPVCDLNTDAPIWIDLFGHVMAEAQAKAFRYRDDQYLQQFWSNEVNALSRGDVFSSVSVAQSYATIGELGLVGRLNAATCGYDFCHTIPCALDPEPLSHAVTVFRGSPVPDDAFVILWSGGYNTWTDVETMFKGLEYAMERNRNIWFVSTGGQIDGHDEVTYPKFLNLVKKSKVRDRFLLKGWLPKNQVPNYYFEADIGINIDTFMYEGMFGSKNRVLDWMRAGLPALIGELCEISRDLPAKGLAYSFPLNNWQRLGETILYLADNRAAVRETGQRAKEYGLSELSFDVTTEPFQRWLTDPSHAPDRHRAVQFQPLEATAQTHDAALSVELEKCQNHLRNLEIYVRHLESEIEKKNRIMGTASPQNTFYSHLEPDPLPTSETPLVSFILVTWNGEKYIEECLNSIRAQTYTHFEVIVVENSSTDKTPNLVLKNFPEMKLIQNEKNVGFSNGVNLGIHASKGELICLINQDAILSPDWLNQMISKINHPLIGIAGCKIYYPGTLKIQHAGGIVHPNGLTDHYGAGEVDTGQYDMERDCAYVTGAAVMIKRQLLSIIGFMDPRFSPAYFEELDLCTRAIRHGYRVRYIPGALVYHHESTSSGKFSRRFYYLYHRNRLKYMMKHHTIRYLGGTFRRFEVRWIRQHLPREQLVPLLKAYLFDIPVFARAVLRDIVRIFR